MRKYNVFLSIILFIITAQFIIPNTQTPTTKNADDSTLNRTMHPPVIWLDKNAVEIKSGKFDIKTVSTSLTCGRCHDTGYIDSHNSHLKNGVKVDCIDCHVMEPSNGTEIKDDLSSIYLRIRVPSPQQCGKCHGIVYSSTEPLSIPNDYLGVTQYTPGEKLYGMTLHTGVIFSPQELANSAMNLKNKEDLHFPWDVHSHRQLDCIACHYIGNDPRYMGDIESPIRHLKYDPRHVKSPGEILKRPDHNLQVSKCNTCHNPLNVHNSLPYKRKHMEALSCQSCHVPIIYGPALRSVDRTVLTIDGIPRIEFAGTDDSLTQGTSLNTKYFTGYKPVLLPEKVNSNENQEGNHNGKYKISPFNLVTTWYWKSGKTNLPVEEQILKDIYFSAPGQYANDIIRIFDNDRDGNIAPGEILLNSDEKISFIKEKLKQKGILNPVIDGVIEAYPIDHGIFEVSHMNRKCVDCHATHSLLGEDILLSRNSPLGISPRFSSDFIPEKDGRIVRENDGRITFDRTEPGGGYYVLGHSRVKWLDKAGLWVFIICIVAITLHAFLRYIFASKYSSTHTPQIQKIYRYRFYERLWHWTMATAVIILALTGVQIHFTGHFSFFNLEHAVSLHNILAGILVVNAVLSLFYHLVTGEIRQFFRFNRLFFKEAVLQFFYYIYGIFKGAPHPVQKTSERKLNPLQQLTYIGLLNVLLPFQVLSGMLMWGAERWPAITGKWADLAYLAPLHNLGSWLFLCFLVVHIYLTTTGDTVFSNIKAMITGYDHASEQEIHDDHRRLMDMKFMDMVGTLIFKMVQKNDDLSKKEATHE